MSLQVVILAAGLGKRMQSNTPKVLQILGGRPLLTHVLETVKKILPPQQSPIIICGHHAELLKNYYHQEKIKWVEQEKQLGTAHALMQALPYLKDDADVLVLAGDVPLISTQTLEKLLALTPKESIGIITKHLNDPTGYGRIIRDDLGRIQTIIEEKDLSEDEKNIHEINTGIYCFPVQQLKILLPQIKNDNSQKELYLTDTIELASKARIPIHSVKAASVEEVLGVNDCMQLSQLERYYQARQANHLLLNGVKIMDPARIDIRGEIKVGKDVTIDVNVIFEGQIELGDNCYIGPNCYLKNVVCKDNVFIYANSVLEDSVIGSSCHIGPFARTRPKTILKDKVHIGNYVEIKNSIIDSASKVNHLTYIGDSEIGKNVNVGAGTITCNYDGANKHKTIIGDNVHIGSGSELVAPLTIGMNATIGAGSIVINDVPANKLTLTHELKQRSIEWARPERKKTLTE